MGQMVGGGKTRYRGNILLFYAFDIGDDIDFGQIRKRSLLSERLLALSPYFKNYNIPLAFNLPVSNGTLSAESAANCIMSKAHRFGVLTFMYRIPFEDSLENLKETIIETYNHYSVLSDDDAKHVYEAIYTTVERPNFFHLKNTYFVVNVVPSTDHYITAQEFKRVYGGTIASLLRLEKASLSQYQVNDILSSRMAYSDEDFLIIDSEASFLYDEEYVEMLEFFETAIMQQLELQYYDRLLDKRLEGFYLRPYQIPWRAYIPIISGLFELPVVQLARLRVDISVITERLESSIKMEGDAYFSAVYSLLRKKLGLDDWKKSIDKKLDIIRDMFETHQHRLETIHIESLELVVIALIAIELILAVFSKR